MYRIDDETSASSMPPVEEASAEGFFTEGDPATGIPATVVRASWLNMVQEELRTIVDAGRIDPSKESNTQVLEALRKLFAPIDTTGIPVGGVSYFAMKEPPSGYLHANGSAVSRDAYPGLFAAIGTVFGAGDGTTTFNLPDLRGEFVRGWDAGRNVDAGRAFGGAQGDAIRNIVGEVGSSNGMGLTSSTPYATGAFKKGSPTSGRASPLTSSDSAYISFDASIIVPTAAENRPRNLALLACIKAFDVAENPGLVDITALANQMSDRVPYADFMGTNQSKTGSGWQKLPGGVILQWGTGTSASGTVVTYPITFPNGMLTLSLCDGAVDEGMAAAHILSYDSTSITKTSFRFFARSPDGNTGNTAYKWLAIGY